MPVFKVNATRLGLVSDVKLTKLREKSADSILYTLEDHAADFPQTVTITSTLPTPRKGNPGTVKTLINVRTTIALDEGKPSERYVPLIAKLEMSCPVGSTPFNRQNVSYIVAAALLQSNDAFDDQFYNGILPQD